MARRKRFVQVGVGGRAGMFYDALAGRFAETCELLAICDRNEGRLNLRVRQLAERGVTVRAYIAEEFERMIAENKPDTVIVTTQDSFHDVYLCRAMELGCDVITEKPMTTDAQKCNRILNTQRRTGRKCTVTFNYRYSPPRTQVKDLLMSGVIGDVRSMDFHWMLDTSHGADYFRRWHRQKENSGGLMVHKATHHFDLANWWLSAVPESVIATGRRSFYTPETARRYGLNNRGERCLDCAEAARCPFRLDLSSNANLRTVYLENEAHDGYQRDRCVFSQDMDIEDEMQAIVRYSNGATMSYSLHAFMPWEGYTVVFNGTKGRLEHTCQESVYVNGDGTIPGQLRNEGTQIKIYPHFQNGYAVDIWQAEGGHGGGDAPLLDDLFSPKPSLDKYLRAADQRAGAYSILTGIAANQSIATGQAVRIDSLVNNIGLPEYPPMPLATDPLPLPSEVGARV